MSGLRVRARSLVGGLSPWGTLGALGFVVMSTSPSLLPRTWATQGAVSAVSGIMGYGLGVFLAWAGRRIARALDLQVSMGQRAQRGVIVVVSLLVVVGFGWASVANIRSQAVTAARVDLRPLTPGNWVSATLLGLVLFALLLGIGRGLRGVVRWTRNRLGRHVNRALAATGAVLVVSLVTLWATDALVIRTALEGVGRAAAKTNTHDPYGRTPPTSALRSGGPGSSESYASLGFEGKRFVTGAPPVAEIAAAIGGPAKEPIRVYASINEHGDVERTADAVVAELKRTKAFERKVLAVYTTTGTGWIDEWSAQAMEYLAGGDSAMATMQYSNLSSFVMYVVDRKTPVDAGKVLFDKVYAVWSALPEGQRPQLVTSGESLGAFGGNGAFPTSQDMLARTQGAVWTGTPRFTPNVKTLMAERPWGTPELVPVVNDGRNIRFFTGRVGLTSDMTGRGYATWGSPKIVYVQHASDPIVWWSPDLLWSQPDWLREPRGSDVNPNIRWYPWVTFWQLTLDMALGLSPHYGHGHRYGVEVSSAWGAVLGADDARTAAVAKAMNRSPELQHDE